MIIHYLPKIALLQSEIELIKNVINLYLPNAVVTIFGSRVKGTSKRFSDVDILIDNQKEIKIDLMNKIKSEISQNIEYLIDILDITKISDEFKNIILQMGIKI